MTDEICVQHVVSLAASLKIDQLTHSVPCSARVCEDQIEKSDIKAVVLEQASA